MNPSSIVCCKYGTLSQFFVAEWSSLSAWRCHSKQGLSCQFFNSRVQKHATIWIQSHQDSGFSRIFFCPCILRGFGFYFRVDGLMISYDQPLPLKVSIPDKHTDLKHNITSSATFRIFRQWLGVFHSPCWWTYGLVAVGGVTINFCKDLTFVMSFQHRLGPGGGWETWEAEIRWVVGIRDTPRLKPKNHPWKERKIIWTKTIILRFHFLIFRGVDFFMFFGAKL